MAKSKIIKDLANGIVDTQTALKRTKVLLQELDNKEILKWVNNEIEGYPSADDVPEYRVIYGQLYGTYFKGSMASHMTYNHVPLSLGKASKEQQKDILSVSFTQGVESIKGMISESEKSENSGLVKRVPAELYPYIAHFNNDPYMIIVTAEVKLNMAQILNICPKVESKLLDILLYLEKQFGNLDELDIDLESKTEEEIKKIANHIYVMIYNDNSVSIGDDNEISDSKIASTISE